MNVSDIQQSVSDLWNFLVPPVTLLLSICVITYFLCGHSLVDRIKKYFQIMSNFEKKRFDNTLIFYGLDKLMPFITLFLIMFFLNASLIISMYIADPIPPSLSYEQELLFLQSSNSDYLATIWANNPNISQFSDLCMLIRHEAEYEKDDNFRQMYAIDFYKDKANSTLTNFNITKFLFLWVIILVIFSRKLQLSISNPFIKIPILLIILLLVETLFIVSFFYDVKQLAICEIHGISMESSNTTHANSEDWNKNIEHFKQQIPYESQYQRVWWHISFLKNDDYGHWLFEFTIRSFVSFINNFIGFYHQIENPDRFFSNLRWDLEKYITNF
jgi:hypothetical protein